MKIKVLFICMGNICRSPTAHGVFEHKVKAAGLDQAIDVDSAGTHAYHVGEAPDNRSQSTALSQGYDLSDQRARAIEAGDCEEFDYVLVMDLNNLNDVKCRCHSGHNNVQLFLDYSEEYDEEEVPDPYYGGDDGFTRVLNLIESASDGLLDHIKKTHIL